MARPYLPWPILLWKIKGTRTSTILISCPRILLGSLLSQTCRELTTRLNTIAYSCRARATGLSSLRTKARRLGHCKIPWMMISTHQMERTSRWCQCLPLMQSRPKGWVPQPLLKRSKPRGCLRGNNRGGLLLRSTSLRRPNLISSSNYSRKSSLSWSNYLWLQLREGIKREVSLIILKVLVLLYCRALIRLRLENNSFKFPVLLAG